MITFTSRPLNTLIAAAVVGGLCMSVTAVSSAAEATTPPQAIVKLSDLNLATSSGARVAYGRIQGAAIDVCSRMYNVASSYVDRRQETCMEKLIADTVTRVNQPALSAVLQAKQGISRPVVVAAANTP